VGEPQSVVLADDDSYHHHLTGKSEFSEIPTALYAFVLFMCAISYWILQRVIMASEGQGSMLAGAIGKDRRAGCRSSSTHWRSW
jgi:hypothetical protein